MLTISQYTGCFLGLAVGDALGAKYEGGPLERILWTLIGKTRSGHHRYTDDTQMSIDLAESYLRHGFVDQHDIATTFAHSYRWSRGYGPSTARLLKKVARGGDWQSLNKATFAQGSFGNGAAMRAPVLALMFPYDSEAVANHAVITAQITHAHSLGIEGARLIALTTYAALNNWDTSAILKALRQWSESTEFTAKTERLCQIMDSGTTDRRRLKAELGNQIAAADSCITAIYFALYFRNLEFSEMLSAVARLGGDVDTIGAMAGAIWGAFNGPRFGNVEAHRIEAHDHIVGLAERLYSRISHPITEPA